jgi:V8-like Glu-specific endopeptidase
MEELAYGVPTPLDGPYAGPNITWNRNDGVIPTGEYAEFPWRAVGVLFFTEPNVGDFRCSAATTYGGIALNIVWTAGHCVANGGNAAFYTNWVFCPAYKVMPHLVYGCWNWAFATTSNEWYYNGALTRDYALVGVQPTGTKQATNVVSAVGGLGFAWNWGRDQNWEHWGYPAASPYDGNYQIVTQTEHRYDVATDSLGPPENSWGSPQTPGSSGSPVTLFWSQIDAYINSEVSFYFSGGPNGNELGHELQGPYYDTQVCSFWKAWTGYSGSC